MVGYGQPFGKKGYRVFVPKLGKVVTAPNVMFLDSMEASLSKRPENLVETRSTDIIDGKPPPRPSDPKEVGEVDDRDGPEIGECSDSSASDTTSQTVSKSDASSQSTSDSDTNQSSESSPNQSSSSDPNNGGSSETSATVTDDDNIDHVFDQEATRDKEGRHIEESIAWRTRSVAPLINRPTAPRGLSDDSSGNDHSDTEDEGVVNALRGTYRHVYNGPDTSAFINALEGTRRNFTAAAFVQIAANPFAANSRIPSTFKQAMHSDKAEQWLEAVQSEVASLLDLRVYKLTNKADIPSNANIISGKWVFKIKPREDGKKRQGRFKARLCARGFLQKEGIDYKQTFSPVAAAASIRVLLSTAAKRGLKLRSADISTAFLYGDLPPDERVYMAPPPGVDAKPGQVMALHRCIYGLKQASRRWFEKLRLILVKAGYKPTKSDPCLYTKQTKHEFTMITVVVDDLLIASDSDTNARGVIVALRKAGLKTKDLGFPQFTIGIHIKRDEESIQMSQQLYLDTILDRFGMTSCNIAATPADPNVKLGAAYFPKTAEQVAEMQQRPYRALVGALLYTTLTRPDVAVAVNELCRYLSSPGPAMWTAAKRVLRYLKGTRHFALKFSAEPSPNQVSCYVDSSHADDHDTRRSRCGYLLYHGDNLVGWKTQMQKRVALSTAEAEYRAATIATKEVIWLRRLLGELGMPQLSPTRIFEDNKACIQMVENPVISLRNKHIEIDAHFIRDHHELGDISIEHISSVNQRADIMTKNLPGPAFAKHTGMLMHTRHE
jgi:hypothetical protein